MIGVSAGPRKAVSVPLILLPYLVEELCVLGTPGLDGLAHLFLHALHMLPGWLQLVLEVLRQAADVGLFWRELLR